MSASRTKGHYRDRLYEGDLSKTCAFYGLFTTPVILGHNGSAHAENFCGLSLIMNAPHHHCPHFQGKRMVRISSGEYAYGCGRERRFAEGIEPEEPQTRNELREGTLARKLNTPEEQTLVSHLN